MVKLAHHCDVLLDKMGDKFREYYLQQLEDMESNLPADATNGILQVAESSALLFSVKPDLLHERESLLSRRMKVAEEDHYLDFILSWHVSRE